MELWMAEEATYQSRERPDKRAAAPLGAVSVVGLRRSVREPVDSGIHADLVHTSLPENLA
jgi:hypothetical protein